MITSKLTRKARTTIPKSARDALDLHAGDEFAYVIADVQVAITKVLPSKVANPFATFDEWAGDADRQAYADL